MMVQQSIIRYDLKASQSAKGIALLLLLWHHLFYLKCDISSFPVCISSHFAQVCVAIFIILSGYGLAVSVHDRTIGVLAFYKKRLPRLYLNYWLIALIFIPIGILFGYRPLETVFETAPYLKLFVQMTGFHIFIQSVSLGYNPTWWFMSLILTLYMLFPLMYYLTKKFGFLFLLVCFLFLYLPPEAAQKWFFAIWLFSFALGIYLERTNGLVLISKRLKSIGVFRFILLGAGILLAVYIRHGFAMYSNIDFLKSLGFDSIYAIIILLFIFEITQSHPLLQRLLAFLGNHLFNIFLFYTFIVIYWPAFIYGFQYPYLIFLVLLTISLIVSIAIEYIKKLLQFDKILLWIDGIKVRDILLISSGSVPMLQQETASLGRKEEHTR